MITCIIFIMVLLLPLNALSISQSGTYTTPFDTVPNFALQPTLETVGSGSWSAASTWNKGRLPLPTDIVRVTHAVAYDTIDGICQVLSIEGSGSVTFSVTQSTRLAVGTLFVTPGGRLEIGTVAVPLPPQYTAEIIIRDIPTNTTVDPNQYGTGLLVLDGTLSMIGATKKPTFSRLTAEVRASETTLKIVDTVTNWLPKDELVLPDSRQATDAIAQANVWHWETPMLTSVKSTVLTVSPLQFDHPGARSSLTQSLDFAPHVGNLTRNIVVRSENPNGTRGHVWLSRHSNIDIEYVRFQELGRTTTALISPTNQIGRYPLHLHHIVNPIPIQGYQFILRGNVVHGGSTEHTRKWAYTIHDSHFGLVEDNIAYNCAGACYMTEDGSETSNLFHHNFAVRAVGTGDRMGMGSEATGFWFRGGNNIVKGNVAASIPSNYPGVQNCGYSIWQQYAGDVRIPLRPGVDTAIAGEYTLTNIYTMPIKEFTDNEVYGSTCGMTAWWVGTEFVTPKGTQDNVIKNLSAWNIYSSVYLNYHIHRLVLDHLVVRGDPTGIGCCNEGYDGRDYTSSDLTIINADIQGVRDGVSFSTDTYGTQLLKDSKIVSSNAGVVFTTLWTSSSNPGYIRPRHIVIDTVKLSPTQTSSAWKAIQPLFMASPVRNLIVKDSVTVKSYQAVAGSDFSVYYKEQAATFIVPQTLKHPAPYGTPSMLGAPTPGLTNAQNWLQSGIAIAGAVAPCADVTTHPEIAGFTCSAGLVPPPVIVPPVMVPPIPTVPPIVPPTPAEVSQAWERNNTTLTCTAVGQWRTQALKMVDTCISQFTQ